jgi:arsenite oxidase small subunit
MKHLSRRKFLQSSTATALLFMAGCKNPNQKGEKVSYPSVKIGNSKTLKLNEPVTFNFPDAESPCVLVKTGGEAVDGIGSRKDIVAFSTLCTHMGCPTTYSKKRLVCRCHYSMFDVSRNGQSYQGLASQWIPQIVLREDPATGDIFAEGVQGLIYGRIGNLKVS